LSEVYINDGNQDVYGFLDPYFINPTGAKKIETHTYITNTLIGDAKQIYLAPNIKK